MQTYIVQSVHNAVFCRVCHLVAAYKPFFTRLTTAETGSKRQELHQSLATDLLAFYDKGSQLTMEDGAHLAAMLAEEAISLLLRLYTFWRDIEMSVITVALQQEILPEYNSAYLFEPLANNLYAARCRKFLDGDVTYPRPTDKASWVLATTENALELTLQRVLANGATGIGKVILTFPRVHRVPKNLFQLAEMLVNGLSQLEDKFIETLGQDTWWPSDVPQEPAKHPKADIHELYRRMLATLSDDEAEVITDHLAELGFSLKK